MKNGCTPESLTFSFYYILIRHHFFSFSEPLYVLANDKMTNTLLTITEPGEIHTSKRSTQVQLDQKCTL